MTPILAISLGCPSGIGPEVAVRAASELQSARPLLVGSESVLRRAASLVGVDEARLVRVDDPRRFREMPTGEGTLPFFAPDELRAKDAPLGKPSQAAGRSQLAWIDAAMELVRDGYADALVTGPASKHAIATSGAGRRAARFRGHTEHLAESLGVPHDGVTMAFWSEKLTIGLATTHLPIRKVARAITPEVVARTTFHLAQLAAWLGAKKPRIAISGLNPHAGEDGLLGSEEKEQIEPGIAMAKQLVRGAKLTAELTGPIGAETAVRLANGGAFDAVVAMYHDQATVPMKLLGFGDAVNVTLGLPIVRTSVDHGTGYDKAGKGTADASGMRIALELGARLALARSPKRAAKTRKR